MTYSRVTVEAHHASNMSIELTDFHFEGTTRSEHVPQRHLIALRLGSHDYDPQVSIGESDFHQFGHVCFAPAYMRLQSQSLAGRAKFALFRFDPERFAHILDITRDWSPVELAYCADIRLPDLQRELHQIVGEVTSPQLGSDLIVNALSVSIFVKLARHFEGLRRVQTPCQGGLAPWQLRRVTRHIRTAGGKVLTSELAKLCDMSERHLRRAFKQSTGMTVHAYVETQWLERAKELLSRSDRSLKGIAADLGFSNPSGLSIAFKRVTGATPSEFRARQRGLQRTSGPVLA